MGIITKDMFDQKLKEILSAQNQPLKANNPEEANKKEQGETSNKEKRNRWRAFQQNNLQNAC